jgi:uncharacterized protein
MPESPPPPVVWVQVMQAMVARELVESFGLPERHAARLLGIVPSSVSQYLSGKRLGPTLAAYLGDEDARRIARRTAQQLMTGPAEPRIVLEASIALGELYRKAPSGAPRPRTPSPPPRVRDETPQWLRQRIVGEQNAVAECMRLAQRSRDELTRALFRQIASDSLRHAEIVASIAAYLDRSVSTSVPTGITRSDVRDLIDREHDAEATGGAELGPQLGGVMRILWDSMEADERKHEMLLQRLLDSGLADEGADRRSRASRRPPRSPTGARRRRPGRGR